MAITHETARNIVQSMITAKPQYQNQENIQRLNALLSASTDKEMAINVALEVMEKYFKEMSEKNQHIK